MSRGLCIRFKMDGRGVGREWRFNEGFGVVNAYGEALSMLHVDHDMGFSDWLSVYGV